MSPGDHLHGCNLGVNRGKLYLSPKMKASFPEPEIISRKGQPVAVILPIKTYREIIERLEDADDAAFLRRSRRRPMHYRPLDDVLADLATEA